MTRLLTHIDASADLQSLINNDGTLLDTTTSLIDSIAKNFRRCSSVLCKMKVVNSFTCNHRANETKHAIKSKPSWSDEISRTSMDSILSFEVDESLTTDGHPCPCYVMLTKLAFVVGLTGGKSRLNILKSNPTVMLYT